jgi:hypothetical protein
MKKFIITLLILIITATYASAYSIYNTAGQDWRREQTYRAYIVFESKAEYESHKATMEKANFFLTDEELDWSYSKSQELSYIIQYNNIKSGAYIVEFYIEEDPSCDRWYAQVNYIVK